MPISKHEEKMLNLQYHMRENQTELQNYLADLDSWEKDIKKKEEELTLTASKLSDKTSDLPPVRNTIHKKLLKKKKREKRINPAIPKKISGYDFRAWDKFDVDKALEEIDNEEKKETSSSEYETDEEWEIERKKHLATAEKDKGNSFFKAGDYERAVEAYSQGIEFDATSAILPANRAMALLKQQKYAAAEIDCTTSISLDPMYVKAYLRRAHARVGLRKIEEAIIDFNRVLDLEPLNKMAKTEVERLQKEKDRELTEPAPPSTLTEGNQGIVKPIYKPPEERSKASLRRISIEEIGIEKPQRAQPPANQSQCSKKIKEQESNNFDALLSSATGKKKPVILEESSQAIENVTNLSSKDPLPVDVDRNKREDPCLNKVTYSLPKLSDSTPNCATSSTKAESDHLIKREESFTINGVSDSKTFESSKEFGVPKSSYQFQADFKLLRNKPEEFFKYFIRIPPCELSKLFGQFLDADILNRILRALLDFSSCVDLNIYNILLGLTEVKRFSMAAMFLSKKEKQVVQDLMQRLADASVCSEEQLAILKKKYDL